MPELPEVETVVRDLRPLVVGRTVTAVRAGDRNLRTPWRPEWAAALVGRRVDGVRRRGKWIVVELEEPNPPTPFPKREGGARPASGHAGASPIGPPPRLGEGTGEGLRLEPPNPPAPFPKREGGGKPDGVASPRLVVHLGMTGQLTAVDAAEPPPDHVHLVFALDGGRELRFRDVRRFGSARVFADEAVVEAFFHAAGLGPEPFGLDPAYFRSAVRGANRSLKAILLDQRVVAGVGNIYADEACHRADLHPGRVGAKLTAADADRLREAVEAVLTAAIAHRGSTIRDYVGGSGLRGGYQDAHAVYGRTGRPCPTCATAIECVRLAGRSSHFCPVCQKRRARSARV